MNHDYAVLMIHKTRAADLQAEARQHTLRRVVRARRALERLAAATTVHSLPPRAPLSPETTRREDRRAA
jgi:hypothetical protein